MFRDHCAPCAMIGQASFAIADLFNVPVCVQHMGEAGVIARAKAEILKVTPVRRVEYVPDSGYRVTYEPRQPDGN